MDAVYEAAFKRGENPDELTPEQRARLKEATMCPDELTARACYACQSPDAPTRLVTQQTPTGPSRSLEALCDGCAGDLAARPGVTVQRFVGDDDGGCAHSGAPRMEVGGWCFDCGRYLTEADAPLAVDAPDAADGLPARRGGGDAARRA